MGGNLWGQVKGAASSGILTGGRPYTQNFWYAGASAPIFGSRTDTIQQAVNIALPGDVIQLGPQEYDENVVVDKAITIVGASDPLATRITALTNGTAITLAGTSAGAALYNLNLEGRGTGGGLALTGQIRRVSIIGCKLHGGAVAAFINPGVGGQIVELTFDDCIFALATRGILNTVGGGDPTHRLRVRNSWFYALTASSIESGGAAINILVEGNKFGPNGDTDPTAYILLDGAGDSGMVSGNFFGTPNDSGGLNSVDADVFWVGNYTVAGVTTAQPS
jgi:hypothetical protein